MTEAFRAAARAVLLSSLLVACLGPPVEGPQVVVLGIAQDGGYPQPGCTEACCRRAWSDPEVPRHVASLGIVDPIRPERWLIDATPDFPEQLRAMDQIAPPSGGHGISGIFLTHAHMGHYTGLMFLGREAMATWQVPVYVMPRMRRFLTASGPWDLLVRLKNVELHRLEEGVSLQLNPRISILPIRIPHREEYTEAVGYRIAGPHRSILYIPDIDKWERWSSPLEEALADVDVAYLDGTFYADGELTGRDMSQIPHPFIIETMDRLAELPESERAKVRFIHLNHTNPALDPSSPEFQEIERRGFRVAVEGERVSL